jgi:phosphatidate cytidylyltransferase
VLRTRVLTALVMVAVLYLGTAYLPPFYFGVALALVLLPAVLEWSDLMGLERSRQRPLFITFFYSLLLSLAFALGMSPQADSLRSDVVTAVMILAVFFWLFACLAISRFPAGSELWTGRARMAVLGVCCMLPTWAGLVQLKYMAVSGYLVLAVIALVSIADIGAFFVGRRWGRSKLAPALSPKKSWAGFWGGIASCALLGAFLAAGMHIFVQPLSMLKILILILGAMLIAVIGAVGDLFESMLKRQHGVKDSGRSLPGHGGLLDRVDSLMAATPAFVLMLMAFLPDVAWY